MSTLALRSPLRQAVAALTDNASFELAVREILLSYKLAAWLGGTALGVSVVALAWGLASGESEAASFLVAVGPGRALIGSALLALTALLTLVAPLRALGQLDAVRWRGYLDQLVTTGIPPWRYFAGQWAANQPLILLILAASAPLVLLFGLLGGADWGRTLASYGLLYAYANLLLLVSYALGVLVHEGIALAVTCALFLAALLVDLAPVPSTLAAWTPARYIVAPFAPALAGADAARLEQLYGAAAPFGVTVPWPAWALALWLLVGLAAAITCALGPLHAFVPGLNNFGAVVLPGDGKRGALRRFRPFLTRRVELAFLFENRGPSLTRWALPLRTLQQLLLLGLAATLAFAVAFDPAVIAEVTLGDLRALHAAALLTVVAMALATFTTARVRSLQQLPVGPWRIPQLACDAAGFTLFLGLLVLLHALAFSAAWDELAAARIGRWGFLSPEELLASCSLVLAVVLASAGSTFLAMRVIGAEAVGQGEVLLNAVPYVLLLVVIPLGGLVGALGILEARLESLEHLVRPLLIFAQLSPATPVVLATTSPGVTLPAGFLVERGFWLLHPLWTAYLLLLTWTTQRAAREEAEVLEAQARGEAGSGVRGAPCAECGGVLSVPLALAWWGGALAPRALGYVRCLECRAAFRAATGKPARLLELRVFALRALAFGALIALVIAAVTR